MTAASLETKVGAFVILGLSLLALAVFLLSDLTLSRRYTVSVLFHDVGGLARKAPVKLSGVQVGEVSDIRLKGDLAETVLSVREGVYIYRDAVFTVGSTGIIGSKYLEIDQGHPENGVVAAGAVVMGRDPLMIEKALSNALESLQKVLNDLGGNPDGKPSLVDNLRASVASVRELTANLNDLVASSKPHLAKAMAKTDEISTKLDQILASLNTSSGTVGALLHDPEMKKDVKIAIASTRKAAGTVNEVLSRLQQFRVFWRVDWRYQANDNAQASHADVGLKIQPRPNHYYYLGGENIGGTTNKPNPKDFEHLNTVDALIGWVKGPLDLSAGVIRSAGGVQAYLDPLYKSHPKAFRLMARSYDFSRNRVINGRQFHTPETDVGFLAKITQWLYLGARYDDVESRAPRLETWLHVPFEDRDVAYLFGLATFGAAGAKGRSKPQ